MYVATKVCAGREPPNSPKVSAAAARVKARQSVMTPAVISPDGRRSRRTAEQDGGVDQDHRREEGQQTDQHTQPLDQPAPEESAVPAEIEHEDEKDGDGDAGQGADLAAAAAAARPAATGERPRVARRAGTARRATLRTPWRTARATPAGGR